MAKAKEAVTLTRIIIAGGPTEPFKACINGRDFTLPAGVPVDVTDEELEVISNSSRIYAPVVDAVDTAGESGGAAPGGENTDADTSK